MNNPYIENLLSFVIPCYRSEHTIEKVVAEIIETVSQRPEWDYEIICVNDDSPDNVYEVLFNLAKQNKRIKVISFVKNMGKHAAVLAGYAYVRGKYTVTLDDDFQSPAYELWKLIDVLEHDECDLVTAIYPVKKESLWKRFGSFLNDTMLLMTIGKPKNLHFENLLAQKYFVSKEMTKYTNSYPYLTGLVLRITRRIKMISMEQRARADNAATGFTFHKSISLFLNGLTAFSVKPLRIATYTGAFIAGAGSLYTIYIVIQKIRNPDLMMGYSSMMCIQLFVGGMLMLMLGLIGEYIGRIYICINQSPQYVIRNIVNIEEEDKN
jgi:undecaprenyl-phosphate 4-deoxy-4-formamido-L-arabinose transferase